MPAPVATWRHPFPDRAVSLIRVAIANLPAMLDDIVRHILGAADDVTIVGTARGQGELVALARAAHPEVVILGMAQDVAEPGWEFFLVDPQLRVLGLELDGRQTYAYELRPHREPLGELSARGLVDAVRRLARARGAWDAGDRAVR